MSSSEVLPGAFVISKPIMMLRAGTPLSAATAAFTPSFLVKQTGPITTNPYPAAEAAL